jgi:uncharacterized membrane protein YecN with MAPEG domain
MTVPTITPLYAGVLALILVALAMRVIRVRRGKRIGIGDGDDDNLARRIRAHANFTEYVPIAVLMMLLIELAGYPAWTIHSLGLALIVGRVVHAWSLPAQSLTGRTIGMVLTFTVLISGALMCLTTAVMALTSAP